MTLNILFSDCYQPITLAAVTTVQFAVAHPENRVILCQHPKLLDSLVQCVQSRHSAIQRAGAAAMPPLSFEPAVQDWLARHDGFVDSVLGLMRSSDQELIHFGCSTLWNLSSCEVNRDRLVKKPGVLDTMTRVLCYRPPPSQSPVLDFTDCLQAVLSALCNLASPGMHYIYYIDY